MSDKPYLSIAEAAVHLGVSENTVREAARRNELPAVRVGGRVVINRELLTPQRDNSELVARAVAREQLRLDRIALEAKERELDRLDGIVVVGKQRRAG